MSPRHLALRKPDALPTQQIPWNRKSSECHLPLFHDVSTHVPTGTTQRAQRNQQVLDPFCGRGTTNFAARLLGLASVGTDTNPVAVSIASAKLVAPAVDEVVTLCGKILNREKYPDDIPNEPFWRWAFAPKTLIEICKLRDFFKRECISEEAIALRAIVLGALHGPETKGAPSYIRIKCLGRMQQSLLLHWSSGGAAT